MSQHDAPNERLLDEALASLAPTGASPGFTRRVLASLDAERRTRAAPGLGVWVLAAAAVAAVGVGIFLGSRPQPPLAALTAERESLRTEHGEIREQLESLRTLAQETRPVLYLGSGDDVDLVLDLSPLLTAEAAARPAALDASPDPIRYY